MSQNTKIQWCDHSLNHLVGCVRVSPGCVNCYAESFWIRRGIPPGSVIRGSENTWRDPIKWNRRLICEDCNRPAKPWAAGPNPEGKMRCSCRCGGQEVSRWARLPLVFCDSLSDWLIDRDVIVDFKKPTQRIDNGGVDTLADFLGMVDDTQGVIWLLLSKRPELWKSRMEAVRFKYDRTLCEPRAKGGNVAAKWLAGTPPRNVCVMASAEDQPRWDKRVAELLAIPARWHGVSVEPMLGPINMRGLACGEPGMFMNRLDWAIFGGESGHGARPCNVDWIRAGVRQCRAAGVAPFVKQLGAVPIQAIDDRTGGGIRLADRKGGDIAEWPEDLRVREWPADWRHG